MLKNNLRVWRFAPPACTCAQVFHQVPKLGSTKTVMTFGSRSGEFTTVSVYGTNNSVVATYK